MKAIEEEEKAEITRDKQIRNCAIDEVMEKLTELEFKEIRPDYPRSMVGTIIGIIEKMKENWDVRSGINGYKNYEKDGMGTC